MKQNTGSTKMNVYGYEVPDEVESAILQGMVGEFTAGALTLKAIAAGAPEIVKRDWSTEYCAMRIVDRLLRRETNTGRIGFSKGVWRVVKTS